MAYFDEILSLLRTLGDEVAAHSPLAQASGFPDQIIFQGQWWERRMRSVS